MMTPDQNDVHDFHREVSLMFLRNTSGFAVRTPKGQKDPGAILWDPKSNTREKSDQTIKVLETTQDNLGVHLFGSLVDVDIDTDNPYLMAALDHFLPATTHVWGRPSRPRTHRLYELAGQTFDPTKWPFLAKIQKKPEIAAEVRGGDLKSARYSLLPGSTHPSGEKYLWENPKAARSTVVHVSEEKLMQAVRFSCVAALIGQHWQEGVRNELCKAFSGFLYKAAAYNEELNADLPFTREEAWDLLEGVMRIADDDPADSAMRRKTFDQTWEKGESGAPIVGATRIGELTGDEDIVGLLYLLLANTPDLQAMDAIFEQYAVIRNTMNLIDLKLGAKGAYVMNREAFVFTLAGNFIQTEKSKVPISAVFLNSPRRTIVDRVSANPMREKIYINRDGMKVANTWTGWEIEPCDEEVTEKDVEWFTDYVLRVICRSDLDLYDWVMTWIADMFQNPAEKPGTALVLVGEQGAGKSMLPEKILRPIIGSAHSTKAGTIEKLTSKFNSHMGGKLLIQGEEVMNSNRRQDADMMKDAITSAIRMVEMKGRDAFEMEDFSRYILTSNHEDRAVNIEAGDRRYTIAQVSDEYAYKGGKNEKKRAEYFGPLFEKLEVKNEHGEMVPNREELAKLHKYLLTYPVKQGKIRSAFETAIKRDTQSNSTRGMDAWLLSMVDCVNPFDNVSLPTKGEMHSFVQKGVKYLTTDGWPQYVQYSKLEASLRVFAIRDYGEARSAQQIAKFFKDNGMVGETGDRQVRVYGERIRVRAFPTRKAIVSYLRYKGYNVMDVSEGEDEPENDGEPQF